MKWFAFLLVLLMACAQKAEQPAQEVVQEGVVQESVDMAKAAQLGSPMKCVSDHEGQTTAIYLKGGKMRMDTVPADAHGIYTADMMYTWRGSEGMMIKMEDMKKLAAEQGEQFTPPSQEQVLTKAEQENSKCEPADVPESMFVPPENVKFEDLGGLMKEIEASAKSLQK